MKVNMPFTFSDTDLRTVRAALGRGGVATRKECRVFIDRAVRKALDEAPEPKARRRSSVDAAIARGVAAAKAGDEPAMRAAVEEAHAHRYPHGCPNLCEACVKRLGITNETDAQRIARVRRTIEKKFGHVGTGVARG